MTQPDTTNPQPTKEPTLDDVGGEPLQDSGFEDETPDPDFIDSADDRHSHDQPVGGQRV